EITDKISFSCFYMDGAKTMNTFQNKVYNFFHVHPEAIALEDFAENPEALKEYKAKGDELYLYLNGISSDPLNENIYDNFIIKLFNLCADHFQMYQYGTSLRCDPNPKLQAMQFTGQEAKDA